MLHLMVDLGQYISNQIQQKLYLYYFSSRILNHLYIYLQELQKVVNNMNQTSLESQQTSQNFNPTNTVIVINHTEVANKHQSELMETFFTLFILFNYLSKCNRLN
ncbi:hypothetical protein TTHERM_000030519 (macronuclear) [Tetrahymena thermophila SB210]|uniref:Uncharacterized protein n=1 Tax=Tetrahymena thermophila (strain SB210) TaxID=312017 RepID=W7XIR7_TETTS|nr:hypothetical protein TTHERM_000030519 [Tetrahymena thermophila SB210]EWS74851.1 hypothetical protein TTHERM_000030519 [Tetrahymena thermophila SB210]|eukprot:XP_012652564.1 hypothetical protein TTHERM_000030519 [Tetrahymena thermophila SB210]